MKKEERKGKRNLKTEKCQLTSPSSQHRRKNIAHSSMMFSLPLYTNYLSKEQGEMRTEKPQTCFSSVPRGTLQIRKPQCRSTKGARFSTPPSSPLWYFSYHTSLHSTAHNAMFGQFQILPLSFSFFLLSVSLMTHSLSLSLSLCLHSI